MPRVERLSGGACSVGVGAGDVEVTIVAPDDADGAEATAAGVARSFSFPRPVAVLNAFMNGLTSRPAPAELVPLDAPEPPVLLEEPEDGCDDDPARTSKFIEATAGWKLVRGL